MFGVWGEEGSTSDVGCELTGHQCRIQILPSWVRTRSAAKPDKLGQRYIRPSVAIELREKPSHFTGQGPKEDQKPIAKSQHVLDKLQ